MKYDVRHITAEVKQVNDDGSVRYRLTSKKVDRHGEVVLPDGGKLDDYKNNPIVLFGHGYMTNVPVGKIDPDSFKVTSTYMDANVIFDEEGKDPFAEMIGDKVRNGFLNAGSIGFRPTVMGNEPVLPKQTGATIQEWELFEFSVVPVPSNTNALVKREFYDECKSLAPNYNFDSIFKETKTINKTNSVPIFNELEVEKAIELAEQLKAGRVLSSKNRNLVKNVADQMRPLLKMLDTLYEATEPKPETEKGFDIENVKRLQDILIKQTIESLEMTKIFNNINDLRRIVN